MSDIKSETAPSASPAPTDGGAAPASPPLSDITPRKTYKFSLYTDSKLNDYYANHIAHQMLTFLRAIFEDNTLSMEHCVRYHMYRKVTGVAGIAYPTKPPKPIPAFDHVPGNVSLPLLTCDLSKQLCNFTPEPDQCAVGKRLFTLLEENMSAPAVDYVIGILIDGVFTGYQPCTNDGYLAQCTCWVCFDGLSGCEDV